MSTRTEMLRHYQLAPGTADEFVTWWTTRIVPLRAAAGFRIEWAYLDRDHESFTWLLSYPGDRSGFEAAEERYAVLPERQTAIAVAPPLTSHQVGYPERII